MLNNKIIIGIDGISYSGKTTLCNKISSVKKNVIIIDESPKFANSKIKISDKTDEIINNSITTLKIEKERTNFLNNKYNNDETIFIYDRTIYSFIAISYAYYKTGMIDYYNNYIDEIINGIITGCYEVPDYFIHLNIKSNELKKRMKEKKKDLPEYWTSDVFNFAVDFILKKVNTFYRQMNRDYDEKKLVESNLKEMTKIDKIDVINFLKEMKK